MKRRERRILERLLGKREADEVRLIREDELTLLLSSRTPEADRALDSHRTSIILPAIALCRALEETGRDPATVRSVLEAFYSAVFERTRRAYAVADRLPFFYPLLRILLRRAMRTTYAESGWRRRWIEDSGARMAFNMETCYYRAALLEHGRGDLLPLFCALDDLVYGSMSRHVSFRRETTLARGGSLCDFAFINARGGGR